MRNLNVNALSGLDSGTVNGSQIDSNQIVSASFHCYFGDTLAAGTFKIQASNDICNNRYEAANFTVTSWTDIPTKTVAITSGAAGLITVAQSSYRWLRAVFVPTAPSTKAFIAIQDLTYTARAFGPSGDLINVTYVDPGALSQALSVSVVGVDITVNLATDGAGVITSTATLIAAAIAASAPATALVSVAITGTGSNVQTAEAQTFLSGSDGGYTTVTINLNALSM